MRRSRASKKRTGGMERKQVKIDQKVPEPEITPEMKNLMEKVFLNSLILAKIVDKFPPTDLLDLRRTSQLWNKVVTFKLLKNDHTKVRIAYGSDCLQFTRARTLPHDISDGQYITITHDMRLEYLNFLLQKAGPQFPSSRFIFLNTGEYLGDSDEAFLQFFKIQGQHIKSLELEFPQDNEYNPGLLLKILSKYTPNLEHLEIQFPGVDVDDDDPTGIPGGQPPLENLSLNSLKSFSWLGNSIPALAILQSAPNLQLIEFQDDGEFFNLKRNVQNEQLSLRLENEANKFLESVIQSGKVGAVKSLHISQNYKAAQTQLTQFSSSHPKLEKIVFDSLRFPGGQPGKELAQSFVQLMNSSKETLEILHFTNFCGFYRLALPQLPKVKELKLSCESRVVSVYVKDGDGHFWDPLDRFGDDEYADEDEDENEHDGRLFHSNFHFGDSFPNLKKVFLNYNLNYSDNNSWTKYFLPNDHFLDALLTVTDLEFYGGIHEKWLERLQILFPSVKKIAQGLNESNKLKTLLPIFSKLWPELEYLKLNIGGTGVKDFDSIFTGMKVETCKSLVGPSNDLAERKKGYEKLRDGTSLLDFKELKKLKISIIFFNIPFSRVSCLYAFDLMPHLSVTLQMDPLGLKHHKDELDLVSPFVRVILKKCQMKLF